MPELPEVETIVRELRRPLKSSRIKALQLRKRGVFLPARGFSRRALAGKTIKDVHRRGKYIIIDLSHALSLVIHLRMTGRLLLYDQDTSNEQPATSNKHSHCVFVLDKNRTLVFNDTRRFGRINLMKTEDLAAYFNQRLGPEPLRIDVKDFIKIAQQKKSNVKAFLLNQKNIAGVGNIYADEALYRARIHPAKKMESLEKKEQRTLYRSVLRVLKEAIKGQGTTIADFRRSGGQTGLFQNKLRVYGHAGTKCRRCQEKIKYMKLGGRGTHFCPGCQP